MIREYSNKDIDDVNNLLKNLNYKINSESFNNDFFKILVYDDVYIKGALVYKYIYDRIEIEYIIVDKKFRNYQIGSKFINYLINLYDDIKNITLEVRKSNLGAIEFYKKNGFKIVCNRKNYYGDEDGLLMIKNIGE